MRKFYIPGILAFALVAFALSCEKIEENKVEHKLFHGAYISDEGQYDANNGSISFYNPDSLSMVLNLYGQVNGEQTGDVIQSFFIHDTLGYIVANHSGFIQTVSINSFKSYKKINMYYPRYMTIAGNKAFITNGIAGGVYVLDLNSSLITDTIKTGKNPEHIINNNGFVYVANGNWGDDSTVSVINPSTNRIINTIVAADGAVNLAIDKNGDLWVLCQGKVVYSEDWSTIISESDSRLVKIHDNAVTSSIIIGQKGDYFNPSSITIDETGENIYVAEKNGVYKISIIDVNFPTQPFISITANGLGVNPQNGDLYILESLGYTTNGKLYVYDKAGNKKDTQYTGIGPNGVVFY